MSKIKILFLCTGNSCRSQMAEAWTRKLKGKQFEPFSAGVEPKGIDPRAIKAMAEVGIDISGQASKDVKALGKQGFDYVVTLCEPSKVGCPSFEGSTIRLHRGFDDPPQLAAAAATEEEAMAFYRRVRDEIKFFVEEFPGALSNSGYLYID